MRRDGNFIEYIHGRAGNTQNDEVMVVRQENIEINIHRTGVVL